MMRRCVFLPLWLLIPIPGKEERAGAGGLIVIGVPLSSPPMEALRIYRSLDAAQRKTFLACFLGWALDALDFFLLTFVVKDVAAEFSVSIVRVTFAITLTLMMRPLGALIFGL